MKKLLCSVILVLLASLAAAEETIWTSDIAAAKERAAKEGKSLFIVLIGSDWTPQSKIFDENILSKPEFITGVVKDYVPVLIDFPKDTPLLPELKKQNENFAKFVSLSGLPSIVLMDTSGRVYAMQRGFRADLTPEQLFKDLAVFEEVKIHRDMCFAQAEVAETDNEKALLYHNALLALYVTGVFDGFSLYGYDKEIAAILKGDPENKSRMTVGWDYQKTIITSRDSLLEKKYAEAIAPLDEFAKKYAGTPSKNFAQKALYAKAQVQAMGKDSNGCIATLTEVVAMDPESEFGKEAAKVLVQIAQLAKEDLPPGHPPVEESKK